MYVFFLPPTLSPHYLYMRHLNVVDREEKQCLSCLSYLVSTGWMVPVCLNHRPGEQL